MTRDPELDALPDVRDGLTRIERIVLWQLSLLQEEQRGRQVPTAMLWGRVVEHVDLSVAELQEVLAARVGRGPRPRHRGTMGDDTRGGGDR